MPGGSQAVPLRAHRQRAEETVARLPGAERAQALRKGERLQRAEELLAEIQPLIAKVETWAGLGPLLETLSRLSPRRARAGDRRLSRGRAPLPRCHRQRPRPGLHLPRRASQRVPRRAASEGRPPLRGVYFAEAARLYRKCRAERKEIDLLEKYPEYFEEEKAPSRQFVGESPPPPSFPTSMSIT